MRSARQSAIRLLQLMMVASVVLPVVLFAFAAWLNYRHEYAVADDRIERSLDILHEHTSSTCTWPAMSVPMSAMFSRRG